MTGNLVEELAVGAEVEADWTLLERAARGDERAFEALVGRHERRVLGLCERLLGGREEARDAAQEVFLRAWRHAGRTAPRGQLFTWLYRIAVNLCLNRMRRRRIARFFRFSELAPAGADATGVEPPDPGADPERAAIAAERWRRTRAAIDGLPQNQRAVVVLARFEGLSNRAIAETLGITEGAVESRLVRALRRLAAAQGGRESPVSGGKEAAR